MQAHKLIEVLDGFDARLMAKVYGDVKRLFYQANKCDDVERVGLQIVEEPRFRHELSILLSVLSTTSTNSCISISTILIPPSNAIDSHLFLP